MNRKVASETATGTVVNERHHLHVTISMEKIDYEAQNGVIRVNGKNVEENQHIKVDEEFPPYVALVRNIRSNERRAFFFFFGVCGYLDATLLIFLFFCFFFFVCVCLCVVVATVFCSSDNIKQLSLLSIDNLICLKTSGILCILNASRCLVIFRIELMLLAV